MHFADRHTEGRNRGHQQTYVVVNFCTAVNFYFSIVFGMVMLLMNLKQRKNKIS